MMRRGILLGGFHLECMSCVYIVRKAGVLGIYLDNVMGYKFVAFGELERTGICFV